ncbi:MAG: hypothetical protein NTZ17_10355 [Phycisphaerae bacterium]|nr:hypothetical protein [Phycisphaerae bacterium]
MSEIIHHPSSITHRRKGIALLMVLLIVMAISIISMGFVARMDTELACGANTLLRVQMDQLAQSGLEHARGLILHPQDVPASFWTNGATAQQLVAGSQDYYDIAKIEQPDPGDYCTYDIKCEAYRKLANGEKTGRSRLAARLRLDPCIALAVGANTTLWNGVKVYGDVYTPNGLTNNGAIYGDVFAASLAGTGTRTGQLYLQAPSLGPCPVNDGYSNSKYSTHLLSGGALPAGPCLLDGNIWHYVGDLDITETVNIKGMLLVEGDLTIRANANASEIVAAKSLPALYVSGNLVIENVNNLLIEGLVVVGGNVSIQDSVSITIVGGLFVGGTLDGSLSTVTIIADPMKAAIVNDATGSQISWSPAAGGFFKSIRRWE